MSKIKSVIITYTDGTYEEVKNPSRTFSAGDINGGSTVARVETQFEAESAPAVKILLTEG